MQNDRHLTNWLAAKFNLCTYHYGTRGFLCCLGEYDLDCRTGTSDTPFGAALDYAACHDGELFDKLNAIELGE